MKLWRLGCVVFAVTSAVGSPAVSDPRLTVGVVEEVTALGQIRLEGRYVPENHEFRQLRVWGVLPDPDYLRSLLVGQQISCWSTGTVIPGPKPGSVWADRSVDVLICSASIPIEDIPEDMLARRMAEKPKSFKGTVTKLGIDLAEYLLKTGHASELCVESFNYFGTCTPQVKQ